jgi:hypothetical protein
MKLRPAAQPSVREADQWKGLGNREVSQGLRRESF